jgi:hypothetical protein
MPWWGENNAIWLPDLGNMLLVGFASFRQVAG